MEIELASDADEVGQNEQANPSINKYRQCSFHFLL